MEALVSSPAEGVTPVAQFAEQIEDIAFTMLTHTASLLEIHDSKSRSTTERNDFAILPNQNESTNGVMPRHSLLELCWNTHETISVSFIHRSAADYLRNNDAAQNLLAEITWNNRISDTVRLKADRDISRTFILALKHFYVDGGSELPRPAEQMVFKLVDLSMSTARKRSRHCSPHELERCWRDDIQLLLHCCSHSTNYHGVVQRIRDTSTTGHLSFVGMIAEQHLLMNDFIYHGNFNEWLWVLQNLRHEHGQSLAVFLQCLLRNLGRLRGASLLEPDSLEVASDLSVWLQLSSKLLTLGLNPNQQCHQSIQHRLFPGVKKPSVTLWELFLHCTMHHFAAEPRPEHKTQYLALISQFLDLGADPNTKFPYTERCRWVLYTSVSLPFMLHAWFDEYIDSSVIGKTLADSGAKIDCCLDSFGRTDNDAMFSRNSTFVSMRHYQSIFMLTFRRYMTEKYIRQSSEATTLPWMRGQSHTVDSYLAFLMKMLDSAGANVLWYNGLY